MATIKPFTIFDTFYFANVNLDITTETFNTSFYGKYLAKWPEYNISIYNCSLKMAGWLIAKVEGEKTRKVGEMNWHGHVSGVTVEPNSRR
jgi:N-terminal acetyltransferase B complex catalytic subunit